ncbi:MarR family winged helix-turn-helix transcriptional regulator [Phenylobacterium sp.]|uniref:MarR family winged helix-turn-helix transcriptional regulator n=1 Tax=Phenylobacterium sp. TaxID=1871053 RepID=UPI002FC5E1B2
MDYTRGAGGAAIGARLRRVSEWIDGDATRVYAALGIDFEQRWFGVLNQLAQHGPASVGELASALRITHVSVSQTRQSLEKAGIVASEADPADARRRRLTLTEDGARLIERLTPLWRAFEEAALELNAEAGDVATALDRLDDALARKSLFDRIIAIMPSPATGTSAPPTG